MPASTFLNTEDALHDHIREAIDSPGKHREPLSALLQVIDRQDAPEIIEKWRAQGVADELAEIFRDALFARPKFACSVDAELHYLSRASPNVHQAAPDSSTDGEMQMKINALDMLVYMCEKGGHAVSKLVLGHGKVSNRSTAALQAIIKAMYDTFMSQRYPMYHAVCARTLYALLRDPDISQKEVLSVREGIVTNVENELKTHGIVPSRQTGWYLHLCAFFVESEWISPLSLSNLCDDITRIAASITPPSIEHMRYMFECPRSGNCSYKVPARDRTVLFERRSELPSDFIQTFEAQNIVLDQGDTFLTILRGWAVLMRAVFAKDNTILSSRESVVQYLSSLWDAAKFVSQVLGSLPQSFEAKTELAETLYALLLQVRKFDRLIMLDSAEQKTLLLNIVSAIGAWQTCVDAQIFAIRCLIPCAPLMGEALSKTHMLVLLTALEETVTRWAKLFLQVPCAVFDLLTVLLDEPVVNLHVLTETDFKKIMQFAFNVFDNGISSLFQRAIDGQISAATQSPHVEIHRSLLMSLTALCDAIARKGSASVEQLSQIATFELIKSSKTVAMLRQRQLIDLVEKDPEVRELVVSVLRPILRLFINITRILQDFVIKPIAMSMVTTMTKLKELSAVLLTTAEDVLDDNAADHSKNSKNTLCWEIVTVYYHLVEFGLAPKNVTGFIDSYAIEAFIYALVNSENPSPQHAENFAYVSFQVARIARQLLGHSAKQHDDGMPFELMYALLCLAQRELAEIRENTGEGKQFLLLSEKSSLATLAENILHSVHAVVTLANAHWALGSVKDLNNFAELLDRRDLPVPLETPIGRYVFQGEMFSDQEKFAYLWRVSDDICKQCKENAVVDSAFSGQATKAAESERQQDGESNGTNCVHPWEKKCLSVATSERVKALLECRFTPLQIITKLAEEGMRVSLTNVYSYVNHDETHDHRRL